MILAFKSKYFDLGFIFIPSHFRVSLSLFSKLFLRNSTTFFSRLPPCLAGGWALAKSG